MTTKKWWLLGDCNKLVTQRLRMGNYFPWQVNCTGRLVGGNQSPDNSGQGQTECNLNNCRQIYKCTLQEGCILVNFLYIKAKLPDLVSKSTSTYLRLGVWLGFLFVFLATGHIHLTLFLLWAFPHGSSKSRWKRSVHWAQTLTPEGRPVAWFMLRH